MSGFWEFAMHAFLTPTDTYLPFKQGCVDFWGQRAHKRGFISNRIVFGAVTPSVYATAIETVGETGSI